MNNDVLVTTGTHQWIGLECAEWIYFMTVISRSCTGQDIIIDNGEFYNHTFVWREKGDDWNVNRNGNH